MHISEAIWVAFIGGLAGLTPSLASFVRTKRTERSRVRIEAGKNELDGRRVSMEELSLVIDNLKSDLARVRKEFDEFRDQHKQEQHEAAARIAQNHRDLEKEQRRANRLQDELLELRARFRILWDWLKESDIHVPSYIDRPDEFEPEEPR